MKIHYLKTWSVYFNEVARGRKKFELRKDDRDFKVGDRVVLEDYDPLTDEYTGVRYTFVVEYILKGGNFGLEDGYCILSFNGGGFVS